MYQLTTDAGFASAPPPEISKETIVKNRIAIRELQLDDLFYLERDLEFHDKVNFRFEIFVESVHLAACLVYCVHAYVFVY